MASSAESAYPSPRNQQQGLNAILPAAYENNVGEIIDIRLRVWRWWPEEILDEYSFAPATFLAVDESGYQVEGHVPPGLTAALQLRIEENAVYYVHALRVLPIDSSAHNPNTTVKLVATASTIFCPAPSSVGHPLYAVTYEKIKDIPSMLLDWETHRAIHAILVHVSPPIDGLEEHKISFDNHAEAFITDDSIYPEYVTLSLSVESVSAHQLFNTEIVCPLVFEATGLKPKLQRGVYGFQTTSFTRIAFPSTFSPPARNLIRRLLRKQNAQLRLARQPHFQPALYAPAETKFLTISEFITALTTAETDAQPFDCTVKASITHIVSVIRSIGVSEVICDEEIINRTQSCNDCLKDVYIADANTTSYRHKLELTIKDSTDDIQVTLSNKLGNQLLRISAKSLETMKSQANGVKKLSKLFKKTRKRQFYFRFRIDPPEATHIKKHGYKVRDLIWAPPLLSNPQVLLQGNNASPSTRASHRFAEVSHPVISYNGHGSSGSNII